ncbi:encapsulin-associated ferritin-like protein [Anaerobranca gottschalkii]|uniref:Ferritin n=1 Tax=Anaerobranca gottschalkii DSM 13577 TaxID=1120990 RepID=A0A1I0A047_9FIRM|nr:ferritin-like domain-containing protein [Anaerobranca gottschalkii]SES87035.1 hypothetical protein SAMN03080614_10156 [Anaerobranca gottschalkii DSM 13577]
MSNYQEPYQLLDDKTRDISKAITSLKEELEAVDYYNQRIATVADEQLKAILIHNRDEEIEHACMTIEWLRRNMPKWDEELRNTLFKEGPIVGQHGDDHGNGHDNDLDTKLKIGDMK